MVQIGQSTDIHRLVRGRKLILRGVEIEHEARLLGHSDTDVLLHVITESILGALVLGDLGKYFPDTDERYKDMNSLWMLRQVCKIMEEKGYAIGSLDVMIIVERSKMAPHIPAMRKHVVEALYCGMEQANIKTTREEELGFIGREGDVQTQCVMPLHKKGGIA